MQPAPWTLDACTAARLMALGELDGERYVRSCLERIAEREPLVHAWADLQPERSLARARAGDRGPRRGALHGIPFGIKDVIGTRDFPTRCNSPTRADAQPSEDAHCVAVLHGHGALALGKTETLEFACGGRFPPTRNPWALERTPGGSSSGSGAAVADGMVPWALGTQTGGSTIRPAAFCGVFALKPTWGRIPWDGSRSYAPHLDTIGLFARGADDLQLLASAWGLAPSAPAPAPASRLRLGVCRTPYWQQAEPEAVDAFEALLLRLGARGVHLRDLALPESSGAVNSWQDEVMQDGGRSAFLPERLQAPELLHADFHAKLDNHLQLTPQRLRHALDRIARTRRHFETACADLDGVLTLSAPGPAPVGLHTQGMATFNRLWTAMQVPCIGIPALWTPGGLPMGLQLVHARYEDERIFSTLQRLLPHLETGRRCWE